MEIIKKDSFRSHGNLNKSDDMFRVTVDMTKREYRKFKEQLSQPITREVICPYDGDCDVSTKRKGRIVCERLAGICGGEKECECKSILRLEHNGRKMAWCTDCGKSVTGS